MKLISEQRPLVKTVGVLRQSCKRFDVALVIAIIILLITGNMNPLLHTPLAFIYLALARARRLELVEQRVRK